MYGVDVGIRSASVFQGLVECETPFDRDHLGEAAGKLLGPIPDTTTEIQGCAIVCFVTKQALNYPGLSTESEISGSHREAEVLHHVWPEDRGFDVLPIPGD